MTLVGAALLLMAGCGGGESKREIDVTLTEWSLETSIDEIKSGTVVFNAANSGAGPHELVVVKTDFPPHLLDLVDHKVDETKVRIAGRMDAFTPDSAAFLELELTPGKFVLLCNIVERVPGGPVVSHYENGMFASLLITP
jgi:hypothetical protein